jgi:hypothetical protein
MIQARSADGVIHQFPDGTPDAVVDQAMQAYAKDHQGGGGRSVGRSFLSGVRKGAAGALDMVTQASPLGQMSSTLQTAANLGDTIKTGRPTMPANLYSANSDRAARAAYRPQGLAAEFADTLGTMAPNVFAPGGVLRRAANWIVPAATSELAGQSARSAGASPTGEAIARGAGALAGAGLSSLNPQNIFDARRPAPTPVQRMGERARQDPAQMRQRAADMRGAGVQPTLTDVVDDAGRGAIRAAANRPTPGRQAANDFSRTRTANLPDRISTQTRRTVSADPRTPDQIRTEMAAQRSTNADQAFGAVRGDVISLSPEGVQALRTDYGRAAIAEAARRERDPQVRAALNRLAGDALDNPSTQITVGMADRISRVLLGQAQAAGGDRDLAGTLTGLGRAIREPAAAASPGYATALEGYGADSRLQEAAGVGEGLLRRNTDEFVDAASGLGPGERDLALASGRRAVERATGENPSAAAGVARRLADAPEQQTRNAALMGPERANAFQGAMREEARAVDNANAIAPRTGSSTFLNAADDGSAVRQAAGGVGELLRGRWGALGLRVYDAWRTRGMSDAQVEQLVRVAIDPSQTDAAIAAIAQRMAPVQRQEFLSLRNAAVTGAISASGVAQGSPE